MVIGADFETSILSLLTNIDVMTLATRGPDGPWATDVYFAAERFELFFWSSPRSRHCRDLTIDPLCAATVHPAVETWQTITGLQLAGRARPVSQQEYPTVIKIYETKFPFSKPMIESPGPTAWSMRIDRVRLIDNARAFGRPRSADVVNATVLGPPVEEQSS